MPQTIFLRKALVQKCDVAEMTAHGEDVAGLVEVPYHAHGAKGLGLAGQALLKFTPPNGAQALNRLGVFPDIAHGLVIGIPERVPWKPEQG